MDSNHRSLRRQIYSLLPLATREPTHVLSKGGKWSRRWDLNPQPADYKSAALPIELRRLIWTAQKPLFQSQLTICVAVFYYGFDMAAQLSYHMDRRNARTFLKFTDKNILYHRAWRHIFSPHRYKPAHFPSAYHKDNRSQWRL